MEKKVEYEYKVVNFQATAAVSDVRKGTHMEKVRAQLELELQKYARDGWELQGQYYFDMRIKLGCIDHFISGLKGRKADGSNHRIEQLVFRRPK